MWAVAFWSGHLAGGAGAAAAIHTLGWNDGGQLIDRAGQKLNYTADGRLSSTSAAATLPVNPNRSPASTGTGGTGNRFYDAAGNLVGITDGTGTTALLADATVHASSTGAATGTRSISFAGQTVAQRVTTATGTKIQFLTPDAVNTSTAITQSISGAPGTASAKRYSDPFGLERGQTPAASTTNNAANPAGFSAANGYVSGLADAGTSLTHLGARDYDPVLGIFTAPDPIYNWGSQGGYSPFTYSNNDPVNQSDASGLCPWCLVLLIPGVKEAIIGGAAVIGGYIVGKYLDTHPVQLPAIRLPSIPSTAASASSAATGNQLPIGASSSASIPFPRPMVGTIPAAAAPPAWGTTYPTAYPGPRGRQGGGSGGPSTSVSQAAAAAEAARIAALIAQNAAMHAASTAAVMQMGNKNNADNAASAGSAGAVGRSGSGGMLPPDDEDDPIQWVKDNLPRGVQKKES